MNNISINKDKLKRVYWGIANAIMIILTFTLGAWFVLFASMFAFIMGMKFAHNNWIVGMPKVIVTDKTIKKEDLK